MTAGRYTDALERSIDEARDALDEFRKAVLEGDDGRTRRTSERWHQADDELRRLLSDAEGEWDLPRSLQATIHGLIETSSSTIDVDDLLEAILRRVTNVLNVDTAAVLLLDHASQQLVARAAYGVEEEVHQGVRVPVGVGFAGRIAAERRPVILKRVDATTVSNPILWEKGIRSMLGVPLMRGDTFLGVLHVGTFSGRVFGSIEQHLLELVAEQVAPVLHSRESELQRAAARILQRSLLPSGLPRLAEMDFATRYVPADESVGGDWYDAFLRPNGDLWVTVGDLSGHGLAAAAVMGRLRSATRAYALHSDDPAAVLELANEKLLFFEPNHSATVLCALSRPPYDTIEIASAGHLPPVIASPGRDPYLAPTKNAPLFGAVEHLDAVAVTVELPPGSLFIAYTDGLIERRGEDITTGLERIRSAVSDDTPEDVCRSLMHELIGTTVPMDDIALLVMRRIDAR